MSHTHTGLTLSLSLSLSLSRKQEAVKKHAKVQKMLPEIIGLSGFDE